MQRKVPLKTDFTKNIKLYYAAVGVIVLGYIILSIGKANSFTSLTLGPVILVIGYLAAIPIALLTGVKKTYGSEEESESKSNKGKIV